MTDKLVDFLGEVDRDVALKQRYQENPGKVAEEFGLDPADVNICAAQDLVAMQQRAASNGGGTQTTDIFR